MYNLKKLASCIKDVNICTSMYTTIVRPQLEYASTVWHWGLKEEQRYRLYRQENISCKILGIDKNVMEDLKNRRIEKCCKKYIDIDSNNNHVLNQFICKKLERTRQYRLLPVRTSRCKFSFFHQTPVVLNSKM